MKSRILAFVAKAVSLVAAKSAGVLCLYIFHQPKVPDRLINR